MTFTVSIKTGSSRQVLDDRLRSLTASGPFRVRILEPVGVGTWAVHLMPTRSGMAIGFGKLAELLVLLAREFDVQAVECRPPSRSIAAAS